MFENIYNKMKGRIAVTKSIGKILIGSSLALTLMSMPILSTINSFAKPPGDPVVNGCNEKQHSSCRGHVIGNQVVYYCEWHGNISNCHGPILA